MNHPEKNAPCFYGQNLAECVKNTERFAIAAFWWCGLSFVAVQGNPCRTAIKA